MNEAVSRWYHYQLTEQISAASAMARVLRSSLQPPYGDSRSKFIMPQLDRGYVLVPERGSEPFRVLPEGVIRVGEIAVASVGLLSPELSRACDNYGDNGAAASSREPVKIAAFDFDGTSISGNSPVLLVRYLNRLGMLSKSVLARIIAWGVAYKTRLPQNESWVRGLVFSAFRGKPVSQVNDFLRTFYDESIADRFRPQIDDIMREHVEAGHVVVCVSATFEPIIARALVDHPIHFGIATRMEVDERGCYKDKVDGLPVEGEEKVAALTSFADALFGAGGWELEWAYGDHHSDRALLAAARNGCAVTPDRPLARTAAERGYAVLACDGENG